jgi:hypothetical protein
MSLDLPARLLVPHDDRRGRTRLGSEGRGLRRTFEVASVVDCTGVRQDAYLPKHRSEQRQTFTAEHALSNRRSTCEPLVPIGR